jgi:hypothetical protein
MLPRAEARDAWNFAVHPLCVFSRCLSDMGEHFMCSWHLLHKENA